MDKIVARLKAFGERRFGTATLVGVAVLIAAYILNLVFQGWITDVALPYVLSGLRTLMAMRIGFFGLLFFLFLCGCVLIALLDTSPTVELLSKWSEKRQGKRWSKPLSIEEQNLIQRVRVFWRQGGEEASDRLGELSNDAFETLRRSNYLGRLLEPLLVKLDTATREVREALANDSLVPLDGVRGLLNSHSLTYREVYGWLLQVHNHDLPLTGGRFQRQLDALQVAHRKYCEKLEELRECPEHGDQLFTWRDTVNTEFKLRPPEPDRVIKE